MTNAQLQTDMTMPSAYTFNSTIIREYDIRGTYEDSLNDEDAYYLGLAFGTYVKKQLGDRICVGYDGRVHSPALADNMIKGLTEAGIEVTSIGLGPTPMLYFAVKDGGADAGIMITGSHNPGQDNGFKMTLQTGSVYGDMIKEIAQIAADGAYELGEGNMREIDIQDRYVERLLKDLENTAAVKIAWDAGNGATGEIMRRLTAQLPGEHILLYDDIDGTFPNHHPDPTVDENLADLQRCVIDNGCDFGIAMDGDGDRIGIVDEQGNILRSDILLTIYAREVLETHKRAPIIGDVKCSQVMFDAIAAMGGEPVTWKTGHSLIKTKMAEMQAPLAGELSGHIFFADKYYGFDDALYCAVRLINAMEDADGPLSSLVAHLPHTVNTPEIRIDVPEEQKFDIVPAIVERLRAETPEGIEINDLDGIRVITEQGWWLLRPSNTQSVLVARVEAQDQAALSALKDMLTGELAKSGYDVTL